MLSEIIKTFTKFPYSFSCFSRCHFSAKHFRRYCVHLQTEQQSIAFILATGMALALIYTYIFPGWSFSKENSPPKINLLQDKIHNSGPRATDGAFGRTLLQTEYGVWRSPERYRVLTRSGGAKLWTFGLLKEALGSLAPGKAPSQDIITSEILKCYKGDAFTKLYSSL